MNEKIVEPTELGFLPHAVEVLGAVGTDLDSASIFETIRVREVTLTPIMREILEPRPSSHWGINE
jgi:hypothetical protein